MNVKNQPVNSLDEFPGWSQGGPEEDFFSDIDEVTTEENAFGEDESIVPSPSSEEEEEEIEKPVETSSEDMFADFQEEEEEEETASADDTPKTESVKVLEFLKNRGLASYELEEGEELTDDLADEIVEDSFDNAVEERVQNLFEELPDVVKQLNTFVLKGGNINDFISQISSSTATGLSENMDLDNEKDQETIVREMMRADGNDEELIDTQIEFLKDSNKLRLFADRNYTKWEKSIQKEREALVERQKAQEKQVRQNIRESKKRMTEYLTKEKNLGGISINREDAKVLPNYINDRTVKLQNGSYISELQKELYYDLPKNEKAFLQLATLMKNRNEDGTFNFEALEEKAKTKVSKQVKDNIRRNKNNLPSNSQTSSYVQSKRGLADFFNPSK